MVMRYLLVCIAGTLLAFGWGAFAWGNNLWSSAIRPITVPEPLLQAIAANTNESGALMYPGYPQISATATASEVAAIGAAADAAYKKGPIFMVLYHKDGADLSDPRIFVRGFLIELFATASLAALIGLGGAGHGPLRRFFVLLAAVSFMIIGTQLVEWNFLFVPGEWTHAMILDGFIGWMLAGLPAVIFLRSMREGDTPKEFRV